MNCPRCGKVVPAGAAFCMNCGQSLASTAAVAAPRRIAPWMIAAAAAAAVLLAILGLSAAGILRFGSRTPHPEVLQAKGQPAAPDILRAQGQPAGPGVAQIQREAPLRMPDDVRRWLEHLERIEKEKNALHRRQVVKLQASMSSMAARVSSAGVQAMIDEDGPEVPSLDLSDLIPVDDLIAEWEALRGKLNSVAVPAECAPLYQNYHGSFVNLQQQIAALKDIGSDLFGTFQKGGQQAAVKQAEGVSKGHTQSVDDLLIRSDEQLGEICDKYSERKWFDIRSDLGGGMMQFGF